MSINSMANAAAARRSDMLPLGRVPRNQSEIARAAMTPPTPTLPSQGEPANLAAAASAPVDTTFNVLFGYIPTEVITVYIAVLAAVQQVGKVTPTDWLVFWIFLFATPVVVWLVYAAKIKATQKPLPLSFGAWPVWEMFAATSAYSAWAFALPHSPFTVYGWYSSGLSGLAVLLISTLLGLLAPFFQKPLGTNNTRSQSAQNFDSAVFKVSGETCPSGSTLVTYKEATDNIDILSQKLDTWDIARLAEGGSMAGSGYNSDLHQKDERALGHALCKRLP